MSAIGFFCTPTNIICLSDGIMVDDYVSKNIMAEDVKKVHLLSESVAVMCAGYGVMAIGHMIEVAKSFGISEPGDVADYLSETLCKIEKSGPLPGQTLFLVVGYDEEQRPKLFQVFTGSGHPYTPKEFPIMPGSADATAHTLNADETSFKGLLSQKLQNGISPEDATLSAFTEMVRDYETKEGFLVGGEIFSETLTPSLVPE